MSDPGRRPTTDLVAALVAAAKAGDEAAMAELDRRYRRMLHGVVRKHLPVDLRPRVGSEDVLQSSLLAAFRALPAAEYGGETSFRHWLLTITLRKLKDRIEHHRRLCRDTARDRDDPVPDPVGERQESPSLILQRVEEQERMLDALDRLSPEDRELVLWRHFEGLTFPSIAEFRGWSVSATQRRYVAVIERLRDRLREQDSSQNGRAG